MGYVSMANMSRISLSMDYKVAAITIYIILSLGHLLISALIDTLWPFSSLYGILWFI
jgi:hypothetical protein